MPMDLDARGGQKGTTPRLRVVGLQVAMVGSEIDVVDDVNLEVASGEVLGLVGESGSGKTTVALALLAYARRGLHISGQVLLNGADLLSLPPAEIERVRGSKVAYVPQDPASALNPSMRVDAQILEVLRIHGNDTTQSAEARLAEVLQEVHLSGGPEQIRRYPHQLSGGQQQRVALAMAFACRPSLIVLDEPTTGLDVSTQRHVLDTVRSHCTTHGVTAVFVSHDLAVVSGLASSVAVMYAGRVVEVGPSAQVFTAPSHPYTRGLIAAIPSADRKGDLVGIAGQPPRPGRRPAGCFFAPRCPIRIDKCSQPPAMVEVGSGVQARCWIPDPLPIPPARQPELRAASTQADKAALTVVGLSAAYADKPVLHDVSMDVPARTCVAVVGESGSGKTTLARCIVGLHPSFEGDVLLGGERLAPGAKRRTKEELRRVQYVFQNPYTSLNPRKTVGQILGQTIENFFEHGASERARLVTEALSDVSLQPETAKLYPGQLSGGERQRVAIARALVAQPEVLVCDEVTSALDVSVQAVIVELLRRLQAERQLTLIFITHNLALVGAFAWSVLVLADGSVVETGTVEDVLERPQHPYTVELVSNIPSLNEPRGVGSA